MEATVLLLQGTVRFDLCKNILQRSRPRKVGELLARV